MKVLNNVSAVNVYVCIVDFAFSAAVSSVSLLNSLFAIHRKGIYNGHALLAFDTVATVLPAAEERLVSFIQIYSIELLIRLRHSTVFTTNQQHFMAPNLIQNPTLLS